MSATRRERGRFVGELVLAPTRELAAQIGESFKQYSRHLAEPVKISGPAWWRFHQSADDGARRRRRRHRGDAGAFAWTSIDHNAVSLSAVKILVLDEADRLLDLGFADELNRILALLPARRQNLLFSATFPADVQALAAALLRDPVRIEVAVAPETAPDILQRAIEVDLRRGARNCCAT